MCLLCCSMIFCFYIFSFSAKRLIFACYYNRVTAPFRKSILMTFQWLSGDHINNFHDCLSYFYIRCSVMTAKAKAIWSGQNDKLGEDISILWMRKDRSNESLRTFLGLIHTISLKCHNCSWHWDNFPKFHGFSIFSMTAGTLLWHNRCYKQSSVWYEMKQYFKNNLKKFCAN